ncbi:MAG TPA: hypothetical protein VHZ03_17140 [Trebonia sp.]|nr:hypothetical protein [Trebonia sp.]
MPGREAISAVEGQFTFTADGLCITGNMLSTWWGPVTRPGDVTARLWLPGIVFDRGHLPGGHDIAEVEGFTVGLHARLAPPTPLPGPAGEDDPGRPGPGAALLESLSGTAAVIAAEFLAWVRLRLRQYWAAPTGAPQPLDATLYDTATGEVIASRSGAPGRPVPLDMLAGVLGSSALDGAALRAGLPGILTAQATGRTGLPERLLSSAFGKLWSGDPDPQTAVFLAVTACETKVKAVLGIGAAARGRPLLSYFDAGCRSATGRSLRQDRELWARLEALVATRNRVTHRGEPVTRPQAEAHLAAAAAVFAWLDSLAWPEPPPAGSGPPA